MRTKTPAQGSDPSIKVPAHISDPKLSWEERYKLLETYHAQEAAIMWARVRECRQALELARKLPSEIVNQALTRLAMHFDAPVMPITRYCEALRQWGALAVEKKIISRDAEEALHLGIEKSDFLARILYAGEEMRTEKCPVHHGSWHGIEDPERPCIHGCGLTGWLPVKVESLESGVKRAPPL